MSTRRHWSSCNGHESTNGQRSSRWPSGFAASPGAAFGCVVFDADRAVELAEQGTRVILVRHETTPDDIHGMAAAQGILTSRGGKTSHAAVVARGMGKPAVTGAATLEVDEGSGEIRVGSTVVTDGDLITIDGTSGKVYIGEVPLVDPVPTPELERLLGWADGFRALGVRANADTPGDAIRGPGGGGGRHRAGPYRAHVHGRATRNRPADHPERGWS